MKRIIYIIAISLTYITQSQTYSGIVLNKDTNLPIENATITLVEDNQTTITNTNGTFSLFAFGNGLKTLQINKEGYVFEDLRNVAPNNNFSIQLREKIKSDATLRWENYLASCFNYNSPNIPNNAIWNMQWTQQNLTGAFAPHTASTYTRRDPSAVIEHNGTFYVWYTYKLSTPSPTPWFSNPNLNGTINVFPWDNADVWYATSTDGFNWDEQGPAVQRGTRGDYDDQSIFTPEIFVHENKFYLVYQTVQWPYIERVKNTVGMAVANSPDGPWTKLDAPILRPTDNGKWTAGSTKRTDADIKGDFDSHKVHDPCLIHYNDKFYLYYKGERMGEEVICGQREIRWGVAIANNPTGPYIKSEYNPITTSGHEVALWKYNDGVAIIQKLDGPERGSVQYATDGVNFEMIGRATNTPDALGLFRPNGGTNTPRDGVRWGLAHRYDWSYPGGANYLVRFDVVPGQEPDITDPDNPPTNDALVIEAESYTNTGGSFNDFIYGGSGLGVNRTPNSVNFVNSGDWMEFPITIDETGDYNLIYNISTPSNNAQVQFWLDESLIAQTNVPNNGFWDNYTPLQHNATIALNAGNYTLKIVASGTNKWQWNLDKIHLEKINTPSSKTNIIKRDERIVVYPNPVIHNLHVKGLMQNATYQILNLNGGLVSKGALSPNMVISTEQLKSGTYLLRINHSNYENATLLVKK